MKPLSKESDKYFASFLDEKEKEQQNMDEIDKAATEDSAEIKEITPPSVSSEDEIKKRNRQNKKASYKLKWKLICHILI